jgi:hypothetical protein
VVATTRSARTLRSPCAAIAPAAISKGSVGSGTPAPARKTIPQAAGYVYASTADRSVDRRPLIVLSALCGPNWERRPPRHIASGRKLKQAEENTLGQARTRIPDPKSPGGATGA